jgi:IS5 family transposase
MAWKQTDQYTLADALFIEHDSLKELDGIHDLLNWEAIEQVLKNIHNDKTGELAYHPVMMFKCLLLQVWYKLSDPALEKSLARDLMFRRFSGIGLSDAVPDHSTIWRFRNLLEQEELYETLLQEINKQLQASNLIIQQGEVSIIDASVIQAKNNRPRKNNNGKNTQDSEGSYNVKAGSDGKRKTTFGFKAHINTDEDGYIKAAKVTTGSLHDSNVFEELLTGTEKEVYADSAYKSRKHDKLLATRKIKNQVLERAYRGKPLTGEQKRNNLIRSQTRTVVERTFGVLKLHYGMAQARYMGIARNASRILMMSMAHNLKRGLAIKISS